MNRNIIVPTRLGIKTVIRLSENSSLIRKYSDMIKRRRNMVKIKNFFIDDLKKKGCISSRSLALVNVGDTILRLVFHTTVWLRPQSIVSLAKGSRMFFSGYWVILR
jgi:hypothetical protein